MNYDDGSDTDPAWFNRCDTPGCDNTARVVADGKRCRTCAHRMAACEEDPDLGADA